MKAYEYKFDRTKKLRVNELGAFPADSVLDFTLRLVLPHGTGVHSAAMGIHRDAWNTGHTEFLTFPMRPVPGEGDVSDWLLTLDPVRDLAPEDGNEGLYYYHYAVQLDDGTCFVFGGERPTELDALSNYVGERQLLIHRPDFHASARFREGLVYHIFVDRFAKSGKVHVKPGAVLDPDWDNGTPQYGEYPGAEVANNVFFGGDLAGITEKLDYIASLGVKTIYLSPVFEAASNHKYDTGDYLKIDPMFGTDADMRTLCREAEARGIAILCDGVFNHTGSDSVYFNREGHYPTVGAYQSEQSPWAHWYHFREFPDDYECWWGVKTLPRVDSADPSYRRFICGRAVDKWMHAGVSGWRLDVADELSDEFLDDFRRAVKGQDPDAVILGEVWEDASDKISYGRRRRYLTGSQLDSVMNYPLRAALIGYVKTGDCEPLRHATEGLYRRYPKEVSDNLLNFLGTHDTERILTLLGGEESGDHTNAELAEMRMTPGEREHAKGLVRLAFGILAGLPGVPCVFYGDEAGMEGYRDPFCRRPFPWGRIDGELLAVYRAFGCLRRDEPVFYGGRFRILSLTPDAFVYLRSPEDGAGDSVLVAASRCGTLTAALPVPAQDLLAGTSRARFTVGENDVLYLRLPAELDPDEIRFDSTAG
ncbi:MAG: glycoside hydrolase family 13 protein [Clostridia bacterium]|nr:glycoside hydrolase family 13 protein [Clostridia bacterium]